MTSDLRAPPIPWCREQSSWPGDASFYELDGEPAFCIENFAMRRRPGGQWLQCSPSELVSPSISYKAFGELWSQRTAEIGQAIVENLKVNVSLEEHGFIDPR